MDEYIGTIKTFSGTFVPQGYLPCDGRTLYVQQYAVLFAVIGNRFGGDGRTTFNLPDLRGRFAMGMGPGPGLTPRNIAASGGDQVVSLTVSQMPNHSHTMHGLDGGFETYTPENAFVPKFPSATAKFYAKRDANQELLPMDPRVIESTGGGQPHTNMPPYLALHFMICIDGDYPHKP